MIIIKTILFIKSGKLNQLLLGGLGILFFWLIGVCFLQFDAFD